METKIIMLCSFDVPPENREAFSREMDEKVGVPTRNDRGCLQYDYTLPINEDDKVILVERWDSEENLAAHLAADYMNNSPIIKAKYGAVSHPVKYLLR